MKREELIFILFNFFFKDNYHIFVLIFLTHNKKNKQIATTLWHLYFSPDLFCIYFVLDVVSVSLCKQTESLCGQKLLIDIPAMHMLATRRSPRAREHFLRQGRPPRTGRHGPWDPT